MSLSRSLSISISPAPSPSRSLSLCRLQDRATFRRLIVKNNAKKRRMYEAFIESVPLLKSLEVRMGEMGLAVNLHNVSSFQYKIKINHGHGVSGYNKVPFV